ncbi:flippase [Candidatus Sumerlaeota bacterium]|nr:flippase [Candidatus Sumerlaeota bacterium]
MGETGKRFLRNVSSTFVARATVKLISFVVTIFIINYLGRERYGIYAIVLNFSMIWMVMIDFGWVDMMVREVSRHREQTTRYFSTYIVAQLGLSFFSIALFLVVILFSGYEISIRYYLLIIAIGLFLFGFTRPFHSILIAHESLHRIAILSFLGSLIGSMVLLGGVITQQPLVYFIWVFNVFIILQCVFYFLFARSKLTPWQFAPDLSLIKPIALMSLPFTAVLVLNILFRQLDIILLSKLKTTVECGIYASASKFVYPLLMFSEAVHWSVYPILSREETENRVGFQRALTKSGKYLVAISLYLAVLIFLLAPDIITTLLKPEYYPAIKVLRVLVWFLPLVFLSRLLFYALVSLNRMLFLVSVYAICLLLFVILNIVLVPVYSFMGTAIAVVSVNALLLAVLWGVSVQKKIMSFRLESLHLLVIALICMVGAVIWTHHTVSTYPGYLRLMICGVAGTVSFAVMLFISGFISPDERHQILSFFRR